MFLKSLFSTSLSLGSFLYIPYIVFVHFLLYARVLKVNIKVYPSVWLSFGSSNWALYRSREPSGFKRNANHMFENLVPLLPFLLVSLFLLHVLCNFPLKKT